MGIYFAAIFIGCVLLGHWLDGKFDIAPFGVLLGTLLGFPLAFYRLLLMVKEMNRELNEGTWDSGDHKTTSPKKKQGEGE